MSGAVPQINATTMVEVGAQSSNRPNICDCLGVEVGIHLELLDPEVLNLWNLWGGF